MPVKISMRLLMTCVVFVSTLAVAQAEEQEDDWKAEVELGYVATGGNTETDTLNLKANAQLERDKWRHSANLEALKASNDEETTAERYLVEGKSDYKFDDRNYVFARISYEEDHFSGYEYQLSEAAGYGRRVIAEPELQLDLEIGPGARQSKLDDGDSDNVATAYGAAKLLWKISDTSRFSENLTVDASEDVTISKSVTALSSRINGNLATKLSYTIKHSSEVPDDLKNTDTEMAVTLVYAF